MIMEFTFYPYVEKNIEKVEERWGVFKLADRSKKVVFIGRGNIRKHLFNHLPDGKAPAEDAVFFSIEYFDTKEEAMEAWIEQVEAYQSKFHSLPLYNR
ncbi:MAG: hypothetical protein QCI82_06370 [Candidatus Thermoplasmatota archaeon]|nr:hypothetical protein [Candidatus Thermoplasmatota archaeon]